MAFSLKKLFWNKEALEEVNAKYRARRRAIDERAAVQEAEAIVAKAALKEATKEAFRENNRKLKEAWRNA